MSMKMFNQLKSADSVSMKIDMRETCVDVCIIEYDYKPATTLDLTKQDMTNCG